MPFAARSRRGALFAILASLAPPAAMAQDAAAQGALAQDAVVQGTLTIENAWARATPRGAEVAGAYLTIVNRGASPDTLTGGSTEVASRFEVHEMTMEGGVMRMRPVGPLVIPAGATVTLSPRGRHIMLGGLKHGLRMGETVQGTLTFAHAGSLPVRFAVEGVGAMAPAVGAAPAMPGMTMD